MIPTAARNDERRSRLARVLSQVTLLELAALVLAIGAMALFAALADAVLDRELATFNRAVLTLIHEHATPALERFALAVTWLGNVPIVVLIGVALGLVLRRVGRRIDSWVLAAVLGGGGILSVSLKAIFAQARPEVFEPLYRASGLSFPSGHSLISYCLWGFIAAWLVATSPRSPVRWLGAALCLAIATAVALSRLVIGVHWPSDIVAGMLVAAFWLAVCFIGRQTIRRRLGRRPDLESTAGA